jgi:proteasome lid subunit RPN8/RPN11
VQVPRLQSSDERLLITETAVAELIAAAQRSHPLETGGILVGVTVGGRPWVTGVIEVDSPDRGARHYRLPAGSTQPAVRSARRRDSRLGYLGDWHSHPGDAGPSGIDLATLAVMSAKRHRFPMPTLVVVRRTPDGTVLEAARIVRAIPRRCEVLATGDLPPQTVS